MKIQGGLPPAADAHVSKSILCIFLTSYAHRLNGYLFHINKFCCVLFFLKFCTFVIFCLNQ